MGHQFPVEVQMVTHLSHNWWMVALRGLVAILFGILVFLMPGISLQALILVLSAYLLVDGIGNVITAVRIHERYRQWWWLLLEGIVSIIAGVIAFVWPGITALTILYVVAAWAVVTGIFEILEAIRLREEIQNEWLLGLSGLLSVIFGILLVISPGAGILALLWMVGAYAILFGILLVVLAFRMRNMGGANRPVNTPA
jgi:uncharacterized membrane protein HdeD (DUF308 family)